MGGSNTMGTAVNMRGFAGNAPSNINDRIDYSRTQRPRIPLNVGAPLGWEEATNEVRRRDQDNFRLYQQQKQQQQQPQQRQYQQQSMQQQYQLQNQNLLQIKQEIYQKVQKEMEEQVTQQIQQVQQQFQQQQFQELQRQQTDTIQTPYFEDRSGHQFPGTYHSNDSQEEERSQHRGFRMNNYIDKNTKRRGL